MIKLKDANGDKLKIYTRVVVAEPLWNSLIDMHRGVVIEVHEKRVRVQIEDDRILTFKEGKTKGRTSKVINIKESSNE